MMAGLTRENCKAILQKYCGDEYDTNFSYCLKPFEKHSMLEVKFRQDVAKNPLRFFVKTVGCNSQMSELINNNKWWYTEMDFYKYMEYISGKGQVTGSVISNAYLIDERSGTLVLEDLSKSGYKKCVNMQFDEVHVHVALASLAKFHAISIVHEVKLGGGTGRECLKIATEVGLFGDIPDDTLEVFVNSLAGIKSSENAVRSKLFGEYKKMLEDFTLDTPGRNVCCHGDLFFDNILFRYDEANGLPTNSKFVDFTCARYRPPAHDLTMLLYTCVSARLRQEQYNDFLSCYYKQLRSALKENNLPIEEILPLNEFELSCKKYMRYARMTVALSRVMHDSCEEVQDRSIRRCTIDSADLYTAVDNKILSIEDIHTIVQMRISTTDYVLKEYAVLQLPVKMGFQGEHMALVVTIQKPQGVTLTLKYFVKILPDMLAQRNFVIENGGYFKETSWFRKLIPHFLDNGIDIIQKCSPKCYLARNNDVLVFEDLKESGYEIVSVRDRLDLDGIRQAIATTANFHAASLILEELKSEKLGRRYRLIEDYATEFQESFYTTSKHFRDLVNAVRLGIPTYVGLLPAPEKSTLTKEDIVSMASGLLGQFNDEVQPSTTFRNAICHGDVWNGNIMFQTENDVISGAILIDFQSYRYAPPAQDIIGMIYLTTDRALRKNHMSSLVLYYYEELARNVANYKLDIKDIIPLDEYLSSVEHYRKFAVTQATSLLQVAPMSDDAMKHFSEDLQWASKFLFADRTENLAKCAAEDPVYRRIQEETLADLWDLCEKLNLQ